MSGYLSFACRVEGSAPEAGSVRFHYLVEATSSVLSSPREGVRPVFLPCLDSDTQV